MIDIDELRIFLKEKSYSKIKEKFLKHDSFDIAEALKRLNGSELILLYRFLPKKIAVETFSNFDQSTKSKLANSFTNKEISEMIDELNLDDVIDLLEEVPANVVQRFLASSTEENREIINKFLSYSDDSAGSIVTIEYVELKEDFTVGQALDYIRRVAKTKEDIYTYYITDDEKHLKGVIKIEDLILAKDDVILSSIMRSSGFYIVGVNDEKEDVALLFQKYDITSVPVVDNEGRMIGVIIIDDILEVIQSVNTEDFQMIAAVKPLGTSYLDTSILVMTKNRIIWLLVLMISSTFTATIISNYQNLMLSLVVLASFIPLLMDTSGNAGSQASALIIRELALGTVKVKDFFKVFLKEICVSILVGIILAGVNFLRIVFFVAPQHSDKLKIAFVVSACLMVSLTVSKILGGLLPIVAKIFKLDPALMAGPLITTIADAITLIAYFNIAKWVLVSYAV
ncbi:magnesium transporter [Borreliella japonica]|uniref:Magnesium transporter MgtE n=1 Tax=Borreliella japonica TaxID=34095 RepID=A0A1G4PG46_BORJA|nr:magnesium transporter [Borreliella japonica]WKC88053.1 magnesium transporter [Borreliella japonica]WKC88987.1 magnesium transporter [Borreliella japonica]SCW31108.1 magnesium transporter [Borreliella japonica]